MGCVVVVVVVVVLYQEQRSNKRGKAEAKVDDFYLDGSTVIRTVSKVVALVLVEGFWGCPLVLILSSGSSGRAGERGKVVP